MFQNIINSSNYCYYSSGDYLLWPFSTSGWRGFNKRLSHYSIFPWTLQKFADLDQAEVVLWSGWSHLPGFPSGAYFIIIIIIIVIIKHSWPDASSFIYGGWSPGDLNSTKHADIRVARLKSRKMTKFITIIVILLPIRSSPPTDFESHQFEEKYMMCSSNPTYLHCTIWCQFSIVVHFVHLFSRERFQSPSEFSQCHYHFRVRDYHYIFCTKFSTISWNVVTKKIPHLEKFGAWIETPLFEPTRSLVLFDTCR